MKKNLLNWMTILLMALVCGGFIACGGGDDDSDGFDSGSNAGNSTAPSFVKAVDMALPSGTKWANANVGANIEEGYGDYFAWGEVKPKDVYSHDNIKYDWETDAPNAKYTKNDGKTVLEPQDDAATMNWGNSWKTPTKEQMEELVNNCKWEVTTQNGISGYRVTASNGNTLFFPAAGHYNEEHNSKLGIDCDYWTSSLETEGTTYSKAWDLTMSLSKGSARVDDDKRDMGLTVRPVRK